MLSANITEQNIGEGVSIDQYQLFIYFICESILTTTLGTKDPYVVGRQCGQLYNNFY